MYNKLIVSKRQHDSDFWRKASLSCRLNQKCLKNKELLRENFKKSIIKIFKQQSFGMTNLHKNVRIVLRSLFRSDDKLSKIMK